MMSKDRGLRTTSDYTPTPYDRLAEAIAAQDAELAALRAQLAEAQAQIEVYKVACDGAAALSVMGEILREEFDAAIKRLQAERDKARAALAEAEKDARAGWEAFEYARTAAGEHIAQLSRLCDQYAVAARRVAAYCRQQRKPK